MIFYFCAVFLGLYSIYCFKYWKIKGIPSLPINFPFVSPFYLIEGVAVANRSNMVENYQKVKAMGHRYLAVTTFIRGVLIIIDLEIIRDLLHQQSQFFDDVGFYVTDMYGPEGHEKILSEGSNWTHMRSVLNPSELSDNLKPIFRSILDISSYLVEAIEDCAAENRDIDVKELLACYTTDVIAYNIYKINCYSYKRSSLKFCKCSVDRAGELGVRVPEENMSQRLYQAIRKQLKYREAGNYKKDELSSFNIPIYEWSESEQEPLKLYEMMRNQHIFFYGSFDVTSTTLYYAIYELCQNLDMQAKARDEINMIFEKSGGDITWTDLNDMVYLDRIIDETLRLYPPTPNVIKRCWEKGCQLLGTDVKITTTMDVVIPLFSLHRDPDYFPDPEKFDPERFNPYNEDKNPQFFMPYGEGPREYRSIQACTIQTKVGLVQILRNFKLTTSSKTRLPLRLQPQTYLRSCDRLYITAEKL